MSLDFMIFLKHSVLKYLLITCSWHHKNSHFAFGCFCLLKQNLQNAFKASDRKITLFVKIYEYKTNNYYPCTFYAKSKWCNREQSLKHFALKRKKQLFELNMCLMISANCLKRFPSPRDAPLWCQPTTSGMTVMAVTHSTLTLSQTTTRAASPPSTEQGHVTMNTSNAAMNPVSGVDITMTTVTARKRSLSCTDARIATPRSARVKGHGITPGVLTSTCARSDASKTNIVIGMTTEVHMGSDSVMINTAVICSEGKVAITHQIALRTKCDATKIELWI